MAVNLGGVPAGAGSGWESRRSPRVSEIWTITPSSDASAGDTSPAAGVALAVTTRMKKPQRVIGPYTYSFSGQTVILTAMFAQTTLQPIDIEVIGLPA